MPNQPEVWLRGPLPQVPPLLQPVAHALLQAQADVAVALARFPAAQLWERPAGVASVGFHLQHLAGVLDRMLTYAQNQPLSPAQLAYLAAEGYPAPSAGAPAAQVEALQKAFGGAVQQALAQLHRTPEAALTDYRPVGRAALPSTVIGLLVHAAEHTQRHVGQLLVTARILAG
ncbi:DinB family protein [Hymenobacter caeli]|uniref:Damage-inducible protein DinB n=1 Tax=Hymenobacter caeli TaxID=2735894 RepID=A0ABX2FQK9_9BACT|nr:DinB family protein [Hymenobacter caeli]NRT18710.1 putative damage-inducible protein DinB [Hymenobacter caeli]